MKTTLSKRCALKFILYMTTAYHAAPIFLKVSIGLFDNFFSSSITFDLDTIFLNWNTTFPAVTVCEIYNGEKIWDLSEEYFGADHDLLIDDFVGEVVFFRGTCTTCEQCDLVKCPHNFTQLLEMFRNKCDEIILNCSYINVFFNCCEEFFPIRTEYGICYAFNSIQARKIPQIEHANNRITGPGHLKFEAATDVQLHIHSPIEIPLLFSEGTIRETVLLGNIKEIVINIMELHNHPSVYGLSVEHRRCRFGNERTPLGRTLGIYEFYSFSTCIVECTLTIHMDRCNCTSHYLTAPELSSHQAIPMCDYRGLRCLSDHYYDIQVERKSCDCMSSCEEPEYSIVHSSADDVRETDGTAATQIEVSLIELPTQRYVRRVTKSNLDLIISVGGIVGLFLNASLIRLLEYIGLLWELRTYCPKIRA